MMQRVGKGLLKLTWFGIKLAINVVVSVASGSPSTTKRYSYGQAYGLLHEDKITIAEFVESIED